MKKQFMLICLICAACSTISSSIDNKPSDINNTAVALDGKMVTIEGWMVIEFEARAIWDRKIDHDSKFNPSRCVSVLVPKSMQSEIEAFNRQHVQITGVFHKNVASMRPLVFLGLCNTTAIELVPGHAPKIMLND